MSEKQPPDLSRSGPQVRIDGQGRWIERDGRRYTRGAGGYYTPDIPKGHEQGARFTEYELCVLRHPLAASRRRWARERKAP